MKIVIKLLLVATIVLASCGIKKTMTSWLGHHKVFLIEKWGPPSYVASDGRGGEILVYEWDVRYQSMGMIMPAPGGGAFYTTPQQSGYTKSRMFYADRSGFIYQCKWQGL